VVGFLLSVTFACGVVIAVAHVFNRPFIAPAYDVVANLTAFACAVAASLLLGHIAPALLSAIAVLCWLVLARRTVLARRRGSSPHREPTTAPHQDRQAHPS
jgi:uncharacterized membrane protein YfcA